MPLRDLKHNSVTDKESAHLIVNERTNSMTQVVWKEFENI